MAADTARTPAPHALLLPYPAQGHVIPFMELLDRGFAVTFVNTEFNHRRVVVAGHRRPGARWRLRLVGVADRMGDDEDRDNFVRLNACMEAMSLRLDALLDADDERLGRVTCVVVDVGMSWALDAVKRRGLPAAALWPVSAVLAVLFGAKKLIRDGVIDDDGEYSYSRTYY
jgi:hypothetical protein